METPTQENAVTKIYSPREQRLKEEGIQSPKEPILQLPVIQT
jgi:hypothetical protein